MNQANMTQAEILDNMRDLRLRELLDGPTAIGKMHGAFVVGVCLGLCALIVALAKVGRML